MTVKTGIQGRQAVFWPFPGLRVSALALALMGSLATILVLVPVANTAAAAEPAYRLTRCVAVGEHGFAASFAGGRKEQRRLSLDPKRLSLGGNVKGEVKLDQVMELRLSPVLQVVFIRPESAPLSFGPLSPECRNVIRQTMDGVLKVVDGQG